MAKDTPITLPLLKELLHAHLEPIKDDLEYIKKDMKKEITEMREEITEATGFIRGAKWAFALLFGAISIGAVKMGMGNFLGKH